MKIITGILTLLFGIIIGSWAILSEVNAEYVWNNTYNSYWSLSDKASTIQQKSEYMDKFVDALKSAGLAGQHDTLWYPTQDNSFDSNLEAIESLQGRLKDIQGMDPNSFQYQSAIQQITAQEQDEASGTIGVLKDCWYKQNHYLLFLGGVFYGVILGILLVITGLFVLASEAY